MRLLHTLPDTLLYRSLTPGTIAYGLLFKIARWAALRGWLKPNTRLHYVERGDQVVLLTPLAGSSSLIAQLNDVRTVDLRRNDGFSGRRVFVMERAYELRMRSFYNKKVRNPTNVSKAVLLAQCPPLTHRTSPVEFVDYLVEQSAVVAKDKHLFSTEQICAAVGRTLDEVTLLRLDVDRAEIESLLGVKLDRVVKSTQEVATFAEPLELPTLKLHPSGGPR